VPLTAQINSRHVATNDGQTLELSSIAFTALTIISLWHRSSPF